MINDDELLLYRMSEHPAPEAIREALAHDSELRARNAALCSDLDALRAMPMAVPAGSQQRWRAALRAGSDSGRRQRRTLWQLTAVAAAALVIGVGIGHWIAVDRSAPIIVAMPVVASDHASVLLHLTTTRQALAALPEADNRVARIESIIADNRLHALAAERVGDAQLARVLRGFEPVLRQLTHLDADTDAGVRAQLDFEARSMQTKLRAPPSNAVQRL